MYATLILCDHAQAFDGKLVMVGAGWTITGPDPCPSALGLMIDVPWDASNAPHTFRLRLLDTEGNDAVHGEDGAPFAIEGQFEVSQAGGSPPGADLRFVAGINLPPLQLPPGRRYIWELVVDDREQYTTRVGFNTRPPQFREA